uniref:BRCA2 n=1 Tax=Caenorhabditis tropicalis TaxID=1561998 RepID=A0A1I7UCI1_9PELO
MASSLDNHVEQDGMCSVYSAQPSETNCSISEVLAKEIVAVNETPDDQAEISIYSVPKSETNVTASDAFLPCEAVNKFNQSIYSVPKSETNVTMKNKFERCSDLNNVLDCSVYSVPPSETNVTMNAPTVSQYTALLSETDVTMADGFRPCKVINELNVSSEYTAKSAKHFYVEHIQAELGIPDSKIIGLEGSNLSIAKIIDSNECLLQLENFTPIPVDFSQIPPPIPSNKSMRVTGNDTSIQQTKEELNSR